MGWLVWGGGASHHGSQDVKFAEHSSRELNFRDQGSQQI